MLQTILSACWLIFVLYWFVSSWFVKPTEKMIWNPKYVQGFVVAVALLLLLLERAGVLSFLHVSSCAPNWHGCYYRLFTTVVSPFGLQLVSILMVILGLCIAIVARRTLADNWSGTIELKKGHELVTWGIYGYMRHPIYTGVFMMGIGTVLFYGNPGLFFVFFVLFGVLTFKMRKEEQLMMEHFPQKYPDYKKKVKALVPFVW